MQKTLDHYGAGILVQQVQLQKVDPPAQVIDAFRDVQAARIDLDRSVKTRRRLTPTAWCRKRAATWPRLPRPRKPTNRRPWREATGQTSRFLKIYEQYKKAPDVTRERMYLETMERVLGGSDKIIVDTNQGAPGVVPYLPLNELGVPAQPRDTAVVDGRPAMKLNVIGGVIAVLAFAALIVVYSALFTVYQTQQALVVRLGKLVRVVGEPGLHVKVPFIDSVIDIDKRILDLEAPAQEVIASDQKRLVVDAFARYRITGSAAFLSDAWLDPGRRQFAAQYPAQFGAAPRARRGDLHPGRARRARRVDGAHPRSDRSRGGQLRHRGGRRAHPARRPARAEQPGGLSAHADRAPARGGRIPRPGRRSRPRKSARRPIAR